MNEKTSHISNEQRKARRRIRITSLGMGVCSVLIAMAFVLLGHTLGEASADSAQTLPWPTLHQPSAGTGSTNAANLEPVRGGHSASAPSPALQTGGIVVDHNSVALFESIPEAYLQAAAAMAMMFMDRSVGGNIDDGLTCLNYPSNEVAPNNCIRWEHVDPRYSVDPSELVWSHPGGYDRSNWDFATWPEASCDLWYDKVDCYLNYISSRMNSYDVLSFQFSYLSVDTGSSIADAPGGYFWDNPNLTDVFDQQAFEAQYPGKVFIYWTSSLSRSIGSQVAEDFNNQMRQYAVANGKPLFDVADIESHDPDGNPCYDNRDGVAYDNGNHSENYPDDGIDLPAICPQYTTEVDGGHLGSVSDGKIRIAKAFWVLMAEIAGWDGTPAHKIYLPLISKP